MDFFFFFPFGQQILNISNIHFEQLGQKFSEGKNFAMFLDGTTGVIDTKGKLLFKIKVEFDECGPKVMFAAFAKLKKI